MKKRLLPPGPRGKPFLGELIAFRRNTTAFLLQAARDFGDICHFKLVNQDVFLLNHPDYVKHVLVNQHANFIKGKTMQRAKALIGEGLLTSEGDYHLRQRRRLQPFFHKRQVALYTPVISECVANALGQWHDGATLDVAEEMMQLIMKTMGRILWSKRIDFEFDRIESALAALARLFPILTLPLSERLQRLPLPFYRRFEQERDYLIGVIEQCICRSKDTGSPEEDLLASLVHSPRDNDPHTRMTDAQIRDEVLTLFLAGHETTATALTWTWYLLSQHPAVEDRLHQELDAVLAGRAASLRDVPKLNYTQKIFQEAIRLYPPVGRMGRRPLTDFNIAGYDIPAKSLIFVSPYTMHHDQRFFRDPETFDPMRWEMRQASPLPQCTYFPFGSGIRKCIGESLAMQIGIIVIATIAQTWSLHHTSTSPIEIQPLITLRPRHGMKMTLRRRIGH